MSNRENPDSVPEPMAGFYRDAGLAMPEVTAVKAEAIPEPYRHLLVHSADMTPVLEAHYEGPIHLRVLERHHAGVYLSRQVVLELDGNNMPVVFGAIEIDLTHFSDTAAKLILDGRIPLGTLLSRYRIAHHSRPVAFFRWSADTLISSILQSTVGAVHYGRENCHYSDEQTWIARIVEILRAAD